MTVIDERIDMDVPAWAEYVEDWQDNHDDTGIRYVQVERGPVSVSMTQRLSNADVVTDGELVFETVPSLYRGPASELAADARELASQCYEIADILIGIAGEDPKADMRARGGHHGQTEAIIVANVRRLLKARDLTQNEFAVSIDYSPTEFSQRMVGRMRWDVNDVERVAHGFGLDPFDFFAVMEDVAG